MNFTESALLKQFLSIRKQIENIEHIISVKRAKFTLHFHQRRRIYNYKIPYSYEKPRHSYLKRHLYREIHKYISNILEKGYVNEP